MIELISTFSATSQQFTFAVQANFPSRDQRNITQNIDAHELDDLLGNFPPINQHRRIIDPSLFRRILHIQTIEQRFDQHSFHPIQVGYECAPIHPPRCLN